MVWSGFYIKRGQRLLYRLLPVLYFLLISTPLPAKPAGAVDSFGNFHPLNRVHLRKAFQPKCIDITNFNPLTGKTGLEYLAENSDLQESFSTFPPETIYTVLKKHGLIDSHRSDLAFKAVYKNETGENWQGLFLLTTLQGNPVWSQRGKWKRQKRFLHNLIQNSEALNDFCNKWIRTTIELTDHKSRDYLRLVLRNFNLKGESSSIHLAYVESIKRTLYNLKVLPHLDKELPYRPWVAPTAIFTNPRQLAQGFYKYLFGNWLLGGSRAFSVLFSLSMTLTTKSALSLPMTFAIIFICFEALIAGSDYVVSNDGGYYARLFYSLKTEWIKQWDHFNSVDKFSIPTDFDARSVPAVQTAHGVLNRVTFQNENQIQHTKDALLTQKSNEEFDLVDQAIAFGVGLDDDLDATKDLMLPISSLKQKLSRITLFSDEILEPSWAVYLGVHETLLVSRVHQIISTTYGDFNFKNPSALEALYKKIRKWAEQPEVRTDTKLKAQGIAYLEQLTNLVEITRPDLKQLHNHLLEIETISTNVQLLHEELNKLETQLQTQYREIADPRLLPAIEKKIQQVTIFKSMLDRKFLTNFFSSLEKFHANAQIFYNYWIQNEKSLDTVVLIEQLAFLKEYPFQSKLNLREILISSIDKFESLQAGRINK